MRQPRGIHGHFEYVRTAGRCALLALVTCCSGSGAAAVDGAGWPDDLAVDVTADESSTSAAAGSVEAASHGTGTIAAGRTPGTFGVSNSGAATYTLPLWTPPGIGAVQLNLALVYNSRAGSGVLGTGWSLAGLSAISRCNRTVAQDGAAAGVRNTPADRLCLDGQQLKLVSGVYGVAGSVYATEIESFARIVANGTIGNGPASFTVTNRHGLVHEYGTGADARIMAGTTGTVRTWALSRIRDRTGAGTGNSIAITYVNEARVDAYTNGSHRVAAISYPTTALGQGPFYRIVFGYSPRPASDVPAGYLSGFVVSEPNKLDSISIQSAVASTPIKTYYLDYNSAPTTGRLRLNAVTECGASSCLRPTTITYQDGARGWSATATDTATASSARKTPLPLELNGDGVTDILFPVDAGSGTVRWNILLGTPSGYGAAIDTGFVTSTTATIIPGQFTGNGRTQFLFPQAGYWHIAGFAGSAGSLISSNTGHAVGGEYAAGDFDGDGLADLMSQQGGLTPTIAVRRNVTVPAAGAMAAAFATTSQAVWTVPGTRQSMPWDNLRVADLNGDGRADIVALSFTSAVRNPKFFATPLLSNGFGLPFTTGAERLLWQESMVTMGDWNADGCSDIIQVRSVYVSNCAGALMEITTGATPATGASLYTAMPADWNGDGRTDLLYVDAASNRWFTVPSTGTGAATPVSTGIAAPSSTTWFVLDADGDGLADLGLRDGNQGQRLKYRLHAGAGVTPDLAARFTDGFGMYQHATYASIARSHHTRLADAVFPEADFQAPLQVVNQFTATDGAGATYQNQFQYFGARVHLQGRGFEGFQSQRIVDTRNGLITVDQVHRQFPYAGMHVQRTVLQPDGTTRVSHWAATPGSQGLGVAGFEQRRFPFFASTLQQEFESGGTLHGSLITESSTIRTYGDGYGNPTLVQTSVTDKDPYSPYFNSSWRTSLSAAYANDASTNWCLGLPGTTWSTFTAPGQSAATRTSTYATDPIACRVTQHVLEPNSPALEVTTNYDFDACGNVNSMRVIGATPAGSPMPARTTTFGYGIRCQLLESATNALGQTQHFVHNHDFGVPTRVTDANGLATAWVLDEFGRRTLETRPDQTRTAWAFESCSGGTCWGLPDVRFLVYETRLGTDGALVRQRMSYYDGYERLRFAEHQRVLGTWTRVAFKYDALGRRIAGFRPYSLASNGYTSWTYDARNRVIAERQHDGAGALRSATGASFAGRTGRYTDALGRTRVVVTDVAGRLRRTTDPAPGGTTQFDYDSTGNLRRIQDPIGAVSSGTYNARDFRTQWTDAAAGTWSYSGNSLNELVGWTDARNQAFAIDYDLLGRVVKRTEPEGTSTWTWGSSAAARNIGRLQHVAGHGYAEALTYDGAGRAATRVITTDQSYRYDFAYDTIGELATVTYPGSPVPAGQAGTRFKIRYGYSYGAPYRIEDVTESQPRVLWTLGGSNDYSSATSEALGAGTVSLSATYDSVTNDLTGAQAGAGGVPGNRQNLAYQWDAAGNLVQRRDLNQGLTESFAVDALNRLSTSHLNGVPNLSLSYDAAGNIVHKSDVGAYTYGNASRRHAVTAAGSHTLAYDANGNATSRNGVTQQWTSYNLPTLLRNSGYQSQFAYGPEHRRWRQVATYPSDTETTHYVGHLLEKAHRTSTGLTSWRHYVPTPSGLGIVVSRNSNASSSTTYVLTDHAGSADTLLDGTGATRAKTSFAAYGSRRGSNWSAATAPDWVGVTGTTRRGFTSHEMLDNLGLVHMNGRVYDAQLGRFLSVDPVIGDVGDSQSLNAYAYAGNRPLTATDPSGLSPDGGLITGPIIASIIQTSLNFLGHHSQLPPPPAGALPGQSAQSDVGMCGPGTFSPTCSGMVLYAAVPSGQVEASGASTWNATSPADPDAADNLRQFFVDFGLGTLDFLVLATLREAGNAYDAATRGEYGSAVVYVGFTLCDVGKACKALLTPFKGLTRAANIARTTKRSAGAESEIVQRAMSRAELEATRASGLLRGGRAGTHYVSDSVNSRAHRAQERLALPTAPDVRVTLGVPRGKFSAPSRVGPIRLPDGKVLAGGGTERMAVGDVPVTIIRVDEL